MVSNFVHRSAIRFLQTLEVNRWIQFVDFKYVRRRRGHTIGINLDAG